MALVARAPKCVRRRLDSVSPRRFRVITLTQVYVVNSYYVYSTIGLFISVSNT